MPAEPPPLQDNPNEAFAAEITSEDRLEEPNTSIPSTEHSALPFPPGPGPASATPPAAGTPIPPQEGSKAFESQVLGAIIDTLERLRTERQQGEGARCSTGVTGDKHTDPIPRTFFGMQNQRFDQGQFRIDNEDYEQTFPEDAYGEECGPNARVFKVYHQEAMAYDNDMIAQSSDSSDVLLVFAGLFSAVLTTFVAQTSQALETDKSAISNSLLSEIVELRRAQANGTSFGDVERAITETEPSSTDVWVNGLWFTSLTLSLATALFAVLTKQWLRHYMSTTSGTIRGRCLIRQFRFMGMQKWHVVTIIGVLPILLHLALGVFFAGLTVFLVPRSLPLSCIVGTMATIIYSLYVLTNLLPVIDIQCPYRTPFSEILNVAGHQLRKAIPRTRGSLTRAMTSVFALLYQYFKGIPQYNFGLVTVPRYRSLKDQEYYHIQEKSSKDNLLVDVLVWLRDMSSNPSVHSVTAQAVGGLPPSQRQNPTLERFINVSSTLIDQCLSIQYPRPSRYEMMTIKEGIIRPGFARRLERVARAFPIFTAPLMRQIFVSYDFYTAFQSSNDLEWRASALPCCLQKDETSHPDIFEVMARILGSPDIKLSPNTWINLFSAASGNTITLELKIAICQNILADESLPVHSNNERSVDCTAVTIGVGLLYQQPEVLVQIFEEDHEADDHNSFPPPDIKYLHALLMLQYFIIRIHQSHSLPDESSLNMIRQTWALICSRIRFVTLNDCSAIYHAVETSLGSPFWSQQDRPFMDSVVSSYIMASARMRELRGPPVEWSCFEQMVKNVKFPVDSYSDVCAGRIWYRGLCDDIHTAYTSFVDVDVLLVHYHEDDTWTRLVEEFVAGLVREHRSNAWTVRRPPKPQLPMELYSKCVGYLHEPEHIFATCKILILRGNQPRKTGIREDVLALAQLDPQNDAWDVCLRRLREWQEDMSDLSEKALEALEALHNFFKKRRQREKLLRLFNPFTAVHSLVGRSNRPTDVEQQDTTVAAAPLTDVSLIPARRADDSVVSARPDNQASHNEAGMPQAGAAPVGVPDERAPTLQLGMPGGGMVVSVSSDGMHVPEEPRVGGIKGEIV